MKIQLEGTEQLTDRQAKALAKAALSTLDRIDNGVYEDCGDAPLSPKEYQRCREALTKVLSALSYRGILTLSE